jgi:predicted phosphodiesterase
MRKSLLTTIGLLFIKLAVAQTSIYDIQYTTIAGTNNTYPSLKVNETVTTGGIVTATNFSDGRYFISSSKGGAWNGVFVYDKSNVPNIGDSILITGKVIEYNGYTEISTLTSFSVISSNNPLPPTTKITTAQVRSEDYEGVLVEVNNCTATTTFDSYGNWWVNDGSGACEIRPGIYNLKNDNFPLTVNYPFNSIIGVVGIHYGSISLNPRSGNDIVPNTNAIVLSFDNKTLYNNDEFELPIKISVFNESITVTSYSMKLQYNPAIFEYRGFNLTGTLSETGPITDVSTSGNIVLNYSGNISLNSTDILVNLKLKPLASGNANIQFNHPTVNGTEVNLLSAGSVLCQICSTPIGDTITVVQRPLLNIPSIVTPGQQLNITCFAEPTTTDWNAELIYEGKTIPLSITQSSYSSDLQRWTLTTTIPNVDLYELYDLRVTASGGIMDDVTNAVRVIDSYKDSYYFVHLTDTHLPTHLFYEDTGSSTDESELTDLYEVIKDINLIRPEFVILTGDLINEGELEDFECRRNHTKAIEMLKKFEVPVYLVPGNHDLGGWTSTPPPQGTSRKEWWRFFGWRQPQIPPTRAEFYTHDYSFDYGNIHFTGLEAYDNYDGYMYSVYGATSFIPSQITWLQNDLAAAGSKKKVLFYHYDFKSELNLTALGVDMALWGHIHSDQGSITATPYNLATAAVCDGKRAFRVIRVNNGILQPQSTTRTHTNGDMLTINFNTANNGTLDFVSATINNNYSQSFSNGLVKFIMPKSQYGYSVTNGTLEQVLESETTATCYVGVTIPAGGNITTSITKLNYPTGIEDIERSNQKANIHPNPFNNEVKIDFSLSKEGKINLSIYNINGQLVKTLMNKKMLQGKHSAKWDGTNSANQIVEHGIFIYRLTANEKIIDSGQIVYSK